MVVPALAERHRVIAMDLPGFGLSSKYDVDYQPSAMADALVGLMDQVGVTKADFAAHSYGCAVLLALALDHPDRVRRIVLSDGFVYQDQMPWFFAWAHTPVVGEALFGLFYAQQMDWRMALSFHDSRLITQNMVDRASAALDKPGTKAAALAVARGLTGPEPETAWEHHVWMI